MNHTPPQRNLARYGAAVIAGAATMLILTPTTANAHGIGEVANRSILDFVPLGIQHMLLGWDHLLFIAGVVLIAGNWRLAAKLITAFVIGHSTTLIIATLSGWQVSATLVDVIIGLSVVFVGVMALRGRPDNWKVFGAIVFAFGLFHGVGLSTRLQALGLPEEGMLARVIAFNVGIEVGQLIAILAIVAVATVVTRLWRTRNSQQTQLATQLTSVGLVAGGFLAVGLVFVQGPAVAPAASGSAMGHNSQGCTEGARTENFAGMGGHTAKAFYEPNEVTPMGDFGHSLGDGSVAFLYKSDLPAGQVAALREMVTGPKGEGLLAGPAKGQTEAVKAVTAKTTLTCATFDEAAVQKFSTAWFESIK